MTGGRAYWEGWNDAAWGYRYDPSKVPEYLRADYACGYNEYLANNGK